MLVLPPHSLHLRSLKTLPLGASRPGSRDLLDADFAALGRPRLPAAEGEPESRAGASNAAALVLDGMVFAPRRLRSGQRAFLQGEAFRNLYAVRAGSFKTSMVDHDGRDQVNRFCFPGDLMGLDGLAGGGHSSTATALEDSDVYAVPVTSLGDPAVRDISWHEVLIRCMGQEIIRQHAQLLLLGRVGAFGRLAAFLLELSEEMRARGYSPMEFHMRMSRADIGSYLCLRLETVSRALSTLEQQGALTVDRRHIVIHSPEQLQVLRDRDPS